MKLVYHRINAFPPLAWLASAKVGREAITILHGRLVETQAQFFIEGAWAGDYPSARIQDTDTVFGSGGVLDGDSIVFVSCTATTDFLYHNNDKEKFAVSNSLPLLLSALDDTLRPDYESYSAINMSILGGIRSYRAEIPTQKGQVRRIMHHNVRFGSNGITIAEKSAAPDFSSFNEYRDFLRSRIGALFANARHPARHFPMHIFSTQSKGYDSTAVNALAAPFGIDAVFTITESKEPRSFHLGNHATPPSDDGTLICQALNLHCLPIDRLNFRQALTNEHFYWAGLDNNQDLNLHQTYALIDRPALLLTGNLGEIWYTREAIGDHRLSTFNDELIRWDQSGHGLSEVRLTAGVVQMAVPFIGGRHREDILTITSQAEMDPYRLGGKYDRPIARRMAEEAGVPRSYFGQTKLGSIVHLPTPNIPVTPALREEFLLHLRRHGLLGRTGARLLPLVQRLNNWIYWNNPNRYFNNRSKHPVFWYCSYLWSRILGRPLRVRMIWTRLDSFLYSFCVDKVRDEYARELRVSLPAADSPNPETSPNSHDTTPYAGNP